MLYARNLKAYTLKNMEITTPQSFPFLMSNYGIDKSLYAHSILNFKCWVP